MEAVLDNHNVVVAGAWNRRLFTPQWIKQEFEVEAEVTFELGLGNPSVPIRLSYEGLVLKVLDDRLIVSATQGDDEDLGRVQELASGILSRLQHTPVTAVGLNFQWNEPEPDQDLLTVFDLSDNHSLADAEVAIQATKITRATLWQERILNLTLNLTEDGIVEVHMNFHREVDSIQAAREQIDGGLVALRNDARGILTSAYQLEF